MILREATHNDLPLLRRFEQGVVEAERPFKSRIRAEGAHYYDLEGLMASEDTYLLVAELDDDIVASGYARIDAPKPAFVHTEHFYLGFMYVSSEQRGKV
ncbi:hypothetical protein GCM10007052_23120 [Halioglobus japonicus]|uniref:hypothetical protein n=1 Tax=Halioglobus japonicus TaxID=930805 RepID=UPI00197AFDAC|nr:hypothetical protein [Halioglobus japonicus]GHD17046.1 hypothetical protein GCM10007052_23120 [Halioglobus japonicus]